MNFVDPTGTISAPQVPIPRPVPPGLEVVRVVAPRPPRFPIRPPFIVGVRTPSDLLRQRGSSGAPGSSIVTLHVRVFAPTETFGFGFEGDNRDFSTEREGVTSRIAAFLVIDLETGEVLDTGASSDPSRCIGPPCSRFLGNEESVGVPKMTTFSTAGAIWVDLAGANPNEVLNAVAPEINVSLELRIHANQRLGGALVGDAFPNTEVFEVRPDGSTTMLHTFSTPFNLNLGPYLYLWRNNRRPMGEF